MKRLLCVLAMFLTLAACRGAASPTGYFRVAVIVDTNTDPVSREHAEAVLAIANEKLIDLTGFGLHLHEFREDASGGSVAHLVENYIRHTSTLPNGILIFSVGDDNRAKINRGYAQQILAPAGFKNAFVSPHLGSGYMYVAVLQFNHRYAACGYAGTDTIQSQVSSHGECREVDGEACVLWNGMQVCQSALPFLEGHTPIDMAAGPVIHEFMHAFGNQGPDDHYGSQACNEAMGWQPAHYDLEEAEYYNNFCPHVYDVFAASYQP
jgi:hypothetical protein